MWFLSQELKAATSRPQTALATEGKDNKMLLCSTFEANMNLHNVKQVEEMEQAIQQVKYSSVSSDCLGQKQRERKKEESGGSADLLACFLGGDQLCFYLV